MLQSWAEMHPPQEIVTRVEGSGKIGGRIAAMETLSAEFVEREYNNRALVPEHAEYFARWERDSQFVRDTLPCSLDLEYGPDPRHRIDFFPAAAARGTLVFIHGGYWRSLDKRMFSCVAPAWVAAGMNVALFNYRLAPAVRIEDIVDDAIAATNWLMASPLPGTGADRVAISGHSAGGHLTAALFATDPSRFTFDTARIAGGIPISAISEFEPIRIFSFNTDFKLDEAAVRRLDLTRKRPTIAAPLVIAAGAAESSEFQRQSRILHEAWAPQSRALLLLPGLNHFSIVDAFTERGQPLYEQALALF
jgi:arylformamidase